MSTSAMLSDVLVCSKCGNTENASSLSANLQTRLRAELDGMSIAFNTIAMRTQSTLRAPSHQDITSVDELLLRWKEIFHGVCAMVLHCQFDVSDDWDVVITGTKLSNSRQSWNPSTRPKLLDPGVFYSPDFLAHIPSHVLYSLLLTCQLRQMKQLGISNSSLCRWRLLSSSSLFRPTQKSASTL